jgi:hypothetical protein
MEIKAYKAGGITSGSDTDNPTTENTVESGSDVDSSAGVRRFSMSGKRNFVEIRYLGFDQRENSRVYRFDVQTSGGPLKEVSVTADMVVFRDYRVGIQEGPFLSGNKLTADLGRGWEGEHELTAADVRAHADAKALTGAERASARKSPRRRPGVPAGLTQQKSPWRNLGL